MLKYLKKVLSHRSYKSLPLYPNIQANLRILKDSFSDSKDLVFREFKIGSTKAVLAFLEGMVDKKMINDDVLVPLMNWQKPSLITPEIISDHLLTISQIQQATDQDQMFDGLLNGAAALFIENHAKVLLLDTRSYESRNIEEPATEVVVRGPKEGFTEKVQVNLTLIRRRLRTPKLILENQILGKQSATAIYIVYLKGIAQESLVEEVRKRLSQIEIDAVLESGYIEQLIEDAPQSPFPTISNTEKPDVVAAKLLEGRVAILVDGTPYVLIVPKLFIESFQSPEDYYSRPYYANIVRILRYMAFFITTMAPSLYVAITTFHQEILPTNLLYTMAMAREKIPFPAVLIALGIGVVYEYFREAGIRLPRPVGSSISIVGSLVIGEMAVRSGLVSAPLLIVVAFTSITSFVVTSLADAATILRLFYTIMAGFLGILGVLIVFIFTLTHLCSLKSFGVNYLSPLAPLRPQEIRDAFLRAPLENLNKRPAELTSKNKQRL